jgi:hypothetical protein
MFLKEDSDDEFGGDVGFTFDELERKEAEKSVSALIEIDKKLYQDADPIIPNAENDENDKYRRYESHGYEANYDVVDDKEILQWRRAFPYLQVTGTKMSTPFLTDQLEIPIKKKINTVSMDYYLEDLGVLHLRDSVNELSIKGFAIKPTKMSNLDYDFVVEDEGEYLARDGILEEVLDIDCISMETSSKEFTSSVNEDRENSCLTPGATKHEEVINLLFAEMWPDIVEALGPFIQQVLDVTKEHPELLEQARQREMDRAAGTDSQLASKEDNFVYAFDGDSDGGMSGCQQSDDERW